VSSAIEYCIDPNDLFLNPIIDSEGKPLRKKSMVTEMNGVNAGIKLKGFQICIKGIEEIVSKAFRKSLVKGKAIDEIFLCFVEDLDSHLVDFLILSLASARVEKVALPSDTCFALSDRTSSCQGGD
jgi:hypothetical protein